jgi:hypothetical protein
MPKKRLPGSQRKPRGGVKSAKGAATTKAKAKVPVLFEHGSSGSRLAREGMKSHHFMGVCLGGGKTDKTSLALVEYYPEQNKIFLSRLYEKVRTEGETSSDLQLHSMIVEQVPEVKSVAFDVPLTFPKCVRCELKCPGYEVCKEPEIKWMWDFYRERNESRRPTKLFTPYTERCAELYLSAHLEETFHPSHALGANLAPLVTRAHFITRRLQVPVIEVNPKISLWRIGRSLNIPKTYLRFHRHSVEGEASRKFILEKLIEKDIAFLYAQDVRAMTENNQAFEAFICAMTAVLEYKGQVEPRPPGFPVAEAWTALPVQDIKW